MARKVFIRYTSFKLLENSTRLFADSSKAIFNGRKDESSLWFLYHIGISKECGFFNGWLGQDGAE